MRTSQILRTVAVIASLVALLGLGATGCGGELVDETDELGEVGQLEQAGVIQTNQMGTCTYPNLFTMNCTYMTEICYYHRYILRTPWGLTWSGWILDQCVPLGGGY